MSSKLLLDVDPGCDDAVMIAMALSSPAIEVVGVTTVAGNSTVDNTTQNALSILTMAGRADIPVAKGCDRPLVGSLSSAEWIHGENGIRGELPEPAATPVGATAAEFIIEQCRKHGDDLTIVAVGPLTNIAVALAQDPELPRMIDSLYLMGGAAMTTGNATPAAEANFHNDPEAASRTLQDGQPHLVGLDVTNSATVGAEYRERLMSRSSTAQVVADWLNYPEEVVQLTSASEGPAIHDAVVVADILEDILSFEQYYAEVDTTGGPSHGSVICDKYGVTGENPNVQIATEIDADAHRELLAEKIDDFIDMCER